MVLRKSNTDSFYRRLYGAEMKTVQLLKRNDDQQEGTVRALTIYNCRRGPISKTSQSIQGDMMADHRATWHFPIAELLRVGVAYLNSLDRIVEYTDDGTEPISPSRWWQAESTTKIDVKLFENYCTVDCVRVDPPRAA